MNKSETIKILQAYGTMGREIKLVRNMERPDGEERIAFLERVQRDVSAALNQLEYVEMDTLWGRYVKNQSMEAIRRRHCYSERQARNIANRALKKLGEALEQSEAAHSYLAQKREDDTT